MAKDESFLRHLQASVLESEFAFLPPALSEVMLDMQFRAREAQYEASYPTAESSIVVCNGIDAGRFLVNWSPDEARIIDIALLPEFRGQGIGAALLRRVIKEGKPVGLQVRPDNPARRLYLRLGFEVVSETPMDCEMRFGR